ncbi:MAG: GNAT family N-acetyltransferase [Proteobacteria bacterium]|nr:GNAT family N-acetyltransferase [Pseudomonadota bacterium]
MMYSSKEDQLTLREMTREEFEAYSVSSFEDFLISRSLRSQESIAEVKRRVGEAPPDRTQNDLWYCFVLNSEYVIGYVWVQILIDPYSAFVFDFKLDVSYRGKGLGRRAMNLVLDLLKQITVACVKLCAFEDNLVARRLYHSMGFKDVNYRAKSQQFEMSLFLDS